MRGIGAVALALALAVAAAGAQSAVTAPAVAAAIDRLGSLDDAIRTEASRTVRRAAPDLAVPALARAVREHKDGYVRYRALVLLCGFGDPAAKAAIMDILADRNDRLRAVAYAWFEHHPDRSSLPALIDAFAREESEFVRPALTRAIAAQGDDPRARAALLPLVTRGQDFFRGTVIEALGDYKAAYALAPILAVAKLDGPLQNDAIIALGKIGDASAVSTLAELQSAVPRERQPSIATAFCLLGVNCKAQSDYLDQAMVFAAVTPGAQPLLRSAAHGLATLAARGSAAAFGSLFDAGVKAKDPARAAVALAVGLAALRNPGLLLDVLEARGDRDGAVELVRDAFDMLEEDFEEERFYVEVRRAYWAAAEGSARRKVADALIQKLEF